MKSDLTGALFGNLRKVHIVTNLHLWRERERVGNHHQHSHWFLETQEILMLICSDAVNSRRDS